MTKMVQTIAAPTVALNPASDSGVSSSDYITNVTAPQFTTTTPSGTTVAVYVGGVAYTGQTLAPGSYTVTAVASDAYGNSATGTAPKTLVIVTSPPSGSWSISGGQVVGGTLTTTSTTPTLTLSFTDPGGISTMAVSTNGGTSYAAATAYASTVTTSLANGLGLYTVVVKLTDVAGNVGTYSQTVSLVPAVSISPATMTVPGSTATRTVTFTVSLSAASTSTVTVAVKTVNGTAVAGTDYTALSSTLTFAPGVTSQTVTVTILGRTLGKVNKSFTVVLSSPTNAGLGTSTSTVTTTGTTAQVASAVAPAPSTAAPLTYAELQPVVLAAEREWAAAGANPAQLAADRFLITTQLPYGEVGFTSGSTIYIDAMAAGWGWYTGSGLAAFGGGGLALADGPAAGHMDLLTVVLHEIGHTLGLPDGCACGAYSGLMQATLPVGVSRALSVEPTGAAIAAPSVAAAPGPARATALPSATLRASGARRRHHRVPLLLRRPG
jgi:hypothetical protein